MSLWEAANSHSPCRRSYYLAFVLRRYEQKDGELLRAIAESRRHTEEEKEALAQMRIQCSGSVPLEKLENILSQFKSGNQTAQEHVSTASLGVHMKGNFHHTVTWL